MSAKASDYHKRLSDFMTEYVFPAEADYDKYRHEAGPNDHTVPPIIEELKIKAKERGLWNLFLPAESGLTNLEYAPLAELTGWSLEIAPEALNCAAPDTGNMETLHLFATEEQRKLWLEPLLNGEIRSAFSMTEPAVASSDARNIETSDRARRRRLRHQRPQMVDLGGGGPALQDPHRDGPHQPRRGSAPTAVDGAGADGHARGDDRPLDTGVRLPGPARSLRGDLRQRPGPGHQSAHPLASNLR